MLLMHGFCTLHIRILGCHNSNVHRNKRKLVTLGLHKSLLWNRRSQNLQIFRVFARHYGNTKLIFQRAFPKFLSDKMTQCNNNDQTFFLMH